MRLVDVIDPVARMRREPRRHEMGAFFHGGDFARRKRLHDEAALVVGQLRVLVPHRHGAAELPIGQQVRAHFLPGNVHILRFVGGIAVEDTGAFMGEVLTHTIGQTLFLMHPGTLGFAQHALLGMALHAEPARTPAKVQR